MADTPHVDTAFETSNATLSPNDLTPTTSKPATLITDELQREGRDDDAVLRTPVQQQFGESLADSGVRDEPATPSTTHTRLSEPLQSLKRDGSQRSPPATPGTVAQDVEMADGDEDLGLEDDGSDNDSAAGDSQRPSKKKKGQRFFCTEFPPCQLSFTRSEHLARHIRKHTGERPFQCHCSRRFSRLDNLRQHAQTVHLNEDIPGDSLAATSTRFQRQIRTDRVRPQTSRSRASTLGSNGGHSRGHSRNLSTSSIASTASSIGAGEDIRRRPQPLAMAQDGSSRARLTLDTYNNAIASSPIQGQYGYQAQTPSGYSSPTSTTFSIGTGSPHFQSGMASPVSTISRSSFYNGARQARRLSVPSGSNPFQNAHTNTYPPPMYYNPMMAGSPVLYSQNSSVFASPTSSVFSHSRRDSETEMEMRRRTWHPSTYSSYPQRPPTSGLSYQQTPDDHHAAMASQRPASSVTRLPGIESFDHAPAGGRQPTEPMETTPQPPSSGRPSDAGLHQNLTRLDIAAANAPVEGQWQHIQPAQMPTQAYVGQPPTTVAPQRGQPPPTAPQMAEPPVTPRRNKRQAWYGGPVSGTITPHSNGQPVHRPSPEDSGSSDGVPTPGTSQGAEYHPVIINPHGTTEAYAGAAVAPEEQKVNHSTTTMTMKLAAVADSSSQSYVHPHDPTAAAAAHTYALQAGHDPRFATPYAAPANNDMGRLEALVAVATSENRAVERS